MKRAAAMTQTGASQAAVRTGGSTRWGRLWKNRWLYLLLAPGLLYFLVFKYVPMWGVLLAFQNFSPFHGFWKS